MNIKSIGQKLAVKVLGTGSYLPARVVTNDELAPRIDSSSEWIVTHTGIESRHVAAADESASTLGAEAARRALDAAGVKPEEIGLIALTTVTPDYGNYPSSACLVQKALGCINAAAVDLAAACSGFVYALDIVKCHLLQHPKRKALIVSSELLSRHLDWSDRSSAMLLGDGAGAVVLGAVEDDGEHPSSVILGADGNGSDLIVHDTGDRRPPCPDPVHDTAQATAPQFFKMDGHAVFTFAVRKLTEMVNTLCSDISAPVDSLDRIFAHQANIRILEAVARRLKVPLDKFYLNIKNTGNTSSASIPLCLDKAVREGTLTPGMRIALTGFGSGLTWAGLLTEWPYV